MNGGLRPGNKCILWDPAVGEQRSLYLRSPAPSLHNFAVAILYPLLVKKHTGTGNSLTTGGPVVKILHFNARGMGSIPSQGTRTPHATGHGQIVKK